MTLSLSWRARGALTGLAAAAIAVTGLPGSAAVAADDPAPLVGMDAADVVKGSYIVVLDDDAPAAAVEAAGDRADDAGGEVKHRYTAAIKGYAAELSAGELAEVREDPAVDHVEPVITVRRFADPVRRLDTQADPVWGLDRIDQRQLPLNSGYFWSGTNEGHGVKAYVIDGGVRATHQDFRDTEGGSTTSRVAAGYDATTEGDGVPNDCDGHGTHVAGTIGGTTYGVAKRVTIVPVQVFRCDGGDTDNSALLAGMDYVVKNHKTEPAVANMSLGGPAAGNGAIDKGVNKMIADGITVVVASGNFDPNDPVPAWRSPIACNYTPSHVTGAITVSATTRTDSRDTAYATYGSCVDVFAPGSAVTSAWFGSDTDAATISGTSMATPHVSGIVAAYLSTHRNATPAQVQTAIKAAATPNAVRNPGTGSPNRLAYSRLFPPTRTSKTDRLTASTGLRLGESIKSPNGLYRLQLQTDGKLALTKLGNRVLWSLGTRKASWVTLQANGNLVAFNYTKGVWSTNTAGNGASELRLQNDGNVILRRLSDNKAVWTTKTKQKTPPVQVTAPTDRITAGKGIYRGGAALTSPNGRYAVYIRASNGVLVVRDLQNARDVWATKALNDDWLTLQTDGNAVLYASNGKAVWSTGTAGKGDSRFVIQNDGNFVLYDNSPNRAVWTSRSGRL